MYIQSFHGIKLLHYYRVPIVSEIQDEFHEIAINSPFYLAQSKYSRKLDGINAMTIMHSDR